jgi:MerR family regulatory protein
VALDLDDLVRPIYSPLAYVQFFLYGFLICLRETFSFIRHSVALSLYVLERFSASLSLNTSKPAPILGAMKEVVFHIGEVSERLGVSPKHLRMLEREGRVPQARRDHNGRIYSEFDIGLLKRLGVGSRPRKLKRPEEVLGG